MVETVVTRSFQRISAVRDWVLKRRTNNVSVGFVPTMGAYHPGHRALMEASVEEADATIVSRYVNQTQFDSEENAESYPRSREQDYRVLEEESVDVVFEPVTEDLYPENDSTHVNVDGQLTESFEGEFRSNFFSGVARIVSKLFNIVPSDYVYFGGKDLQQFLLVDRIIKDLHFPQSLRIVPVERDENGVAYSSRNRRFGEEDYETAVRVRRVINQFKEAVDELDRSDLVRYRSQLNDCGMDLDYLDVVTLPSFEESEPSDPKSVLIVAGEIGDVRLKDNRPLHADTIRELL